jgi:hypothetical protein
MVKRLLVNASLTLALWIAAPVVAVAAPIISVVSYTVPATPLEPFLVPIVISGGVQVISWDFDLTYDPSDLQINDPGVLDLFGRYVTEGDFFASGAPFNLLVPGVIDLDSSTLLQTGLLFGVHGAYGGLPPAPSGGGIIAFVEFIAVGEGDSTIRVSDQSVTSAVPEPSATILLAGVLTTLLGTRRRRSVIYRHLPPSGGRS